MILWSKTIKIIPLLHFILCVSSDEELENILDDGQQCISKNQQCHILNYIDDIETVNDESSQKIQSGPSKIHLDIGFMFRQRMQLFIENIIFRQLCLLKLIETEVTFSTKIQPFDE